MFLSLQNCGLLVNDIAAETAVSATEDMCFGGRDFKNNDTSPQQLQLIRQCMAAQLNIAATLFGGGSCDSEYPDLADLIAECCDALCNSGATGQAISGSGCIEALDAFNNSDDTLAPFEPFTSPGPAQPAACRESNGNGWVNGGRNLGPR